MIIKTFIRLQEEVSEEKLKHLEHAEDHHINAGHEGAEHAFNTLRQTANVLRGKKSTATVMTKYDGSPSIIFGRHPESGNFFVGSKSVFNKQPKINYTEEDIEKNHGHAPGLVSKLKTALKHLPKVTPKSGVYQADIMHTKEDVKTSGNKVSFTPNTIKYSVHKDSDAGKKIKDAKIGVAVHTSYKGDDLTNMKAQYGAKVDNFNKHPDVHVIGTHLDHANTSYTKDDHAQFSKHIQAASTIKRKIKPEHYNILNDHQHRERLKTYINSAVRNNARPHVEGYKAYIAERSSKEAEKVKTPASKEKKISAGNNAIQHVTDNHEHFKNILDLHHHIQQAKNVLVNSMSRGHEYEHSIAGQKTKPEGFVSVINNRPTKLTDRYEFNRMNFLARK